MPEKRFFNKYPYTDFHELNLDWVVEKTQDCVDAVEEMDDRVTTLETSMTNVQGRLTTAEERIARQESDIRGLSAAVGEIRDGVTALENAEIQDADMIDGVSSVEAGNASVSINFSTAEYENGAKTAGEDVAVIPSASTTSAGVMVPGDKAKLALMTANGDNVTFAGKVTGADPTGSGDFTTKSYVDSLAIGGTASGSYSADILTDKDLSKFTNTATLTVKDYSYGLIHEYQIDLDGYTNTAIAPGELIATAIIPSAIKPKHILTEYMEAIDGETQIEYDGISFTYNTLAGRVTISNNGSQTIPSGAEFGAGCRIVFVNVSNT